jgi:hypothetical protein
MAYRSYKDASRNVNWGRDETVVLDIDQIRLGATLRIADALELIAKDRANLQQAKDYWEREARVSRATVLTLRKSNAALRGYLKRMKSKATP